jgi:glycosyltransferase involved in cell wall biosynthesis
MTGTWTRKVQTYIAVTDAAKRKFVEGGLPADRIVVKSNFIAHDPGLGMGEGKFALFVGRLCEEKGIRTLLQAWKALPDVPLKIAGDGPLRDLVAESTRNMANVSWLGYCNHANVLQLLKDAFVLVVPSVWYEGDPLIIIEASACGTPVILSDLGSMGEWAAESGLGMRFAPGDAVDLAKQVRALNARAQHFPSSGLASLRMRMRQYFLAHYTAEQNYRQLLAIYESALVASHA